MCRGADMEEAAAKELEREANRFAATLLMPDRYFNEGIRARKLDELADRFLVSQPAMAWRLYNAGLAGRPDTDGYKAEEMR